MTFLKRHSLWRHQQSSDKQSIIVYLHVIFFSLFRTSFCVKKDLMEMNNGNPYYMYFYGLDTGIFCTILGHMILLMCSIVFIHIFVFLFYECCAFICMWGIISIWLYNLSLMTKLLLEYCILVHRCRHSISMWSVIWIPNIKSCYL